MYYNKATKLLNFLEIGRVGQNWAKLGKVGQSWAIYIQNFSTKKLFADFIAKNHSQSWAKLGKVGQNWATLFFMLTLSVSV
jgi:hypothetical protein